MTKPTYNPKVTQADFPAAGEAFSQKFVQNFSAFIGQSFNLFSGGLALGDNFNGAVQTLNMAHGVPQLVASPLRNNARPIGAVVLACDTQSNPSISMTTSTTVNGTLTVAPAGSVFLTALYPITVTDWFSYTPTGSWTGANVTYKGDWRRVGDTMEVQASIALTGAPTGTTLTQVSLPSGTIDTTKIPNFAANKGSFGTGNMLCAGNGSWFLSIAYGTTSAVRPLFHQITGFTAGGVANTGVGDNGISATAPGTFANGDRLDFWFRVPIVGWGITGTTANVLLYMAGA